MEARIHHLEHPVLDHLFAMRKARFERTEMLAVLEANPVRQPSADRRLKRFRPTPPAAGPRPGRACCS